jgi:hypothetical protein
MKTCHHCGHDLKLAEKMRRTDSCPYCQSDLKCCLNCRFFDPGANNQCREPQAEWCADKEKSNFCEYFDFREVSPLSMPGHGGAQSEQARARQSFDSLFKKR